MNLNVSRRDFIKSSAVGAAGMSIGLRQGLTWGADVERPNIVLINVDDLGTECLGCYGSETYVTPNVDKLSDSGMRFEHCYATPLCSPSRVMLMTGRYPFRTGWVDLIGRGKNPLSFLDPEKELTFGHVLKQAGYTTGVCGKWQLCELTDHPTHVEDCGFDEHCLWTWVYDKEPTSRYWNPTIIENGMLREDVFEERYGPDVYSDFAVDFVRRHADKPFFLYYPMALTHNPPHETPDRLTTAKHPRGDKRGKKSDFPGMVAYMDKLVGRLISTLDELSLRENTLILFTTDNGTHRDYSGKVGEVVIQGGKSKMNDAGTRMPMIASWKGRIKPGQVCDDLLDFSDFMPTFTSLAGVGLPTDRVIDGQSFVPSMLNQPGSRRTWAFIQFQHKQFVRDQRWKLHNDGRLYDMVVDPIEQMPVADAGSPEAAAARKFLGDILDSLNNV